MKKNRSPLSDIHRAIRLARKSAERKPNALPIDSRSAHDIVQAIDDCDYLTVSQAAAIIGIGQPSVSKAVAAGKIPAIRLARQGVFILRRDAMAYKRARERRLKK
jgi:excisionase family DNA binding protein